MGRFSRHRDRLKRLEGHDERGRQWIGPIVLLCGALAFVVLLFFTENWGERWAVAKFFSAVLAAGVLLCFGPSAWEFLSSLGVTQSQSPGSSRNREKRR